MNHTTDQQAFVLSIVSGKGGAGKSLASVNLALTLQQRGLRVALIDADPGMGNCATLLNARVSFGATDWIEGQCSMEDLMQPVAGITLLTAVKEPGFPSDQTEILTEALDQIISQMSGTFDVILIDTPAGLGDINLWALDRSELAAMLLLDEPTSVSDVYRFCKYVLSIDPSYPFAVLVNMAEDADAATQIHGRFNTIVKYFLKTEIPSIGFLPYSEHLRKSVRLQQPAMLGDTDSTLRREFNLIAENMLTFCTRSRGKSSSEGDVGVAGYDESDVEAVSLSAAGV